MENGAAQIAVQAFLESCRQNLGRKLRAAYLFDGLVTGDFQTGESDTNLLLVLSEAADLHDLHRVYRPFWVQHQEILTQAPIVLPKSALSRYLHLYPILAQHLLKNGRLLAGDNCLEDIPPASRLEELAHLACEIMGASAAVAPRLLQPAEGQKRLIHLRRLFYQITGQPAADNVPAAILVGQLTQHVVEQLADLQAGPEDAPSGTPVDTLPTNPPELLPQLQAIYEFEDQLVLVFPDQPAADVATLIARVQWPTVADNVGQHYSSIHITTPDLLRLCLYYGPSAAQFFGRYGHAWGNDLLHDLDVPFRNVVRDLARRPAEISAVALPRAYLMADDDEFAKLIHDFQNKLLNIQLQQELFARSVGRARAYPPDPLPGRETEPTERIEAILHQLDWWADYYYTYTAEKPAIAQPAS